MATHIVRSRRGFFGWVFLLLFIGFNALMLWAAIGSLASMTSGLDAATTDAERAGAAIGITMGLGVVMFFWVAGAIILGLLALLTRGRQVIVETKP
jgi:hypothetical protein